MSDGTEILFFGVTGISTKEVKVATNNCSENDWRIVEVKTIKKAKKHLKGKSPRMVLVDASAKKAKKFVRYLKKERYKNTRVIVFGASTNDYNPKDKKGVRFATDSTCAINMAVHLLLAGTPTKKNPKCR